MKELKEDGNPGVNPRPKYEKVSSKNKKKPKPSTSNHNRTIDQYFLTSPSNRSVEKNP